MTYQSRMCAAVVVASTIHVSAVLVPWDRGYPNVVANPGPTSEPVVMRLQPDQPAPRPKRLVDISQPSEEPPDAMSDLIAEANSKAADEQDTDSKEDAPRMEEVDEFERLATAEPAKPVERPPIPQTQPAPESPVQKEPTERIEVAQNNSELTPFEREVSAAQPPNMAEEPIDRQRDSQAPDLPQGRTRGRKHGGVETTGILNFQANQHEIAPYMKVVRNRVERRWRQAILLRYSGSTRRKAVLDCAIAPDGRIVEVTIFDSGGSGTYAEMCRQAVLAAGPFPPFPFEVPPGYRSQNIEIRWTFSYL